MADQPHHDGAGADEGRHTLERHINRSDSIYAVAVSQVVKSGWHCGTARLVGALLFTVVLQLALVGLLWQVATTGNLNSKRSEPDNIWVELGRTRRHLVTLQDLLTNATNGTRPHNSTVTRNSTVTLPTPCLESLCKHYPFFPDFSPEQSSPDVVYKECLDNFCCFVEHPQCLHGPGASKADIQKQTYLDKSVNLTGVVDLCFNDTIDLNKMTKQQFLEYGCDTVQCAKYAAEHELQGLEYGWGLFHVTNSTPRLHNDSECGVKPSKHHEFAGNVNNWFHRYRYENELTPFIMASYLVMLVVSFNEVRQAVHLLVFSAAKAGALPAFFTPDAAAQGRVPGAHGGLSGLVACFILLAPVLQLLVAFVLMSCGGALLLIIEQQNSRASIIFNAVALAFVLELDDRVGLIMKMQQSWMRGPDEVAGVAGAPMPRRAAGYVVFAITGLLLLSHTLLLAPQTPAQMLAFHTTAWVYIRRGQADVGTRVLRDWSSNPNYSDGMTYNFLEDPRVWAVDYIDLKSSIWNTFAFHGFAGLTRLPSEASPKLPISRADAIGLCAVYLVVAVLTVLLLCHSYVPCSAAHWPWVLTGAQMVLVIAAQLQYITMYTTVPEIQPDGCPKFVPVQRHSNSERMEVDSYGWLAVLVILFVFWTSKFMWWPIIHSRRHHPGPNNNWGWVTRLGEAALVVIAQRHGVRNVIVQGWGGLVACLQRYCPPRDMIVCGVGHAEP